jgi:hypothetical protein
MSAASLALENDILNKEFGATNYSPPASHWVALFTTLPNEDGTGGVEVSGGSYARQEIVNNTSNWTPNPATAGQKSNANAINFPPATADWGIIVGVALMSASSGTALRILQAVAAREVKNGDTYSIPANGFVITVE